jgi:hypothetical protein
MIDDQMKQRAVCLVRHGAHGVDDANESQCNAVCFQAATLIGDR